MSDASGKRIRSSPGDSSHINKKYQSSKDSDMTPSDFKEFIIAVLDDKLAPLATKNDLTALNNELISLRDENSRLWEEVRALHSFNKESSRRIEELEIAARSSNLIFRGLKTSKETINYEEIIKEFCFDILKVSIPVEGLFVRPLGQSGNPNKPLLVTFSHQNERSKVLRSCKVLRGTGFTIHLDLPESARKKRGKLLLVKKEVHRLNKDIMVRIHPSALRVGDSWFEWCSKDGLVSSGKPASEKLSAVVGANMSPFLESLKQVVRASDVPKASVQSSSASASERP